MTGFLLMLAVWGVVCLYAAVRPNSKFGSFIQSIATEDDEFITRKCADPNAQVRKSVKHNNKKVA